MKDAYTFYKGCLLGLAVGDALGCAVDEMTLEQIRTDYGPEGLLGFDLANGSADVSSHTQLAAFTANGLLTAMARCRPELYLPAVKRALSEWSDTQHTRREPERTLCWVSRDATLRRRCCMDTRMLDTIHRQAFGSPERPFGTSDSPAMLTTAVAVGMYFHERRMEPAMIGTLAANIAALTHGDRQTILSGAVLAYSIAGILQEPTCSLQEHFLQAAGVVRGQFGDDHDTQTVARTIRKAIAMTSTSSPDAALERLGCTTALQCLAAAVYTSLAHSGSFDAAMITAVNHSGRSAAVGAVTGAILGARLGVEALPEFYLESLACSDALSCLAVDLAAGNPAAGLFDDEWDQKYVQGRLI